MSISKYDRRHWGYFLLAIVATIPFGLFMAYATREDVFGGNSLFAFVVFAVIGAAIWSINLLWWRNIDDVHRQGHLNSWYWGGLSGGFAFLLWLIASKDHVSAYGQGAFHMILAQLALGLALYLVWKVRGGLFKSGQSE